MTCLTVRERLGEHALGVLPPDEHQAVDRHLEWCAACRKEAAELQRAAATLAYSVAPVEPPAGLEERVVGAVRDASGRRRPSAPRGRVAAAGVLAAMLALSGLGWGAVMAGRAERAEEQAADARERQRDAFARFEEVLSDLPGLDPEAIVEVSTLLSPRLRQGRGDALVLLSPSGDDLAFVLVDGLAGVRPDQLPLEVRLVTDGERRLVLGEIRTLNSGGGGGVYRNFAEDLTEVSAVVIRDARGKVLLNGTLSVYDPAS
ncbi:MAG: zf-HC2 domain-containing protein [Actinomycetota bacterium]